MSFHLRLAIELMRPLVLHFPQHRVERQHQRTFIFAREAYLYRNEVDKVSHSKNEYFVLS